MIHNFFLMQYIKFYKCLYQNIKSKIKMRGGQAQYFFTISEILSGHERLSLFSIFSINFNLIFSSNQFSFN